ncbi:MAG TPA: ATP-binding protein [Candidatus Saccharimonadales bacterium]|nr:ATP-binding protein [Candidatus Saccharimonadales bacterium]
MFAIFISFVTFLYLLATSLVVLVKNSRSRVNTTLGFALVFLAGWTMGVAGLATSFGRSILYGRLVFTMAALGLHGLYLFVYFVVLQFKNDTERSYPTLSSVVATVAVLSTLTPWVLEKVIVTNKEVLPTPVNGPLYFVFIVWAFLTALAIAARLIKSYKYARGIKRAQAQVILFGVSSAVAVGLLTNAILPVVFKNSVTATLTPLSMIILSASLSYAVLKHKFLDIRLVVARAAGYILALLVLVSGYAFISYFVADRLSVYFNSQQAQRLLNVGLLIFVAITFNPVKRFFDRLTNKFFYRDAYNPQELFNSFNEALVANNELEPLLTASTGVIARNLKADFCNVALAGRDMYHPRLIGTKPMSFTKDDITKGQHLLAKADTKIIVADYLNEDDPLRAMMLKNGTAIMTKLKDGEDLGYLLLGTKRSGNPYNGQDIRAIEGLTDELVIAIQNSLRFEQIERFNETLQDKINDATRKLRSTNDKLRMLDETKDDFISMASHQLRTPLTSVKGYVSMVLDGDAGKLTSMQRKLLNQSYISAQRMVYLISDLLNVSRLRTGKFVIETTPSNLSRIVKDEVDQLQETAKGRNLDLIFDRPEHFPMLMLDETKMRQVIMNFIDNAIYYTPAGGKIVVTLAEKPQTIEFTVVDNGIGVPKHEQHHLFSKFYRADNAKRARPDGTGLGLFMAKKVVIAQGGAIIFKSQEGKGSTFGFSFAKDRLLPSHMPVSSLDTTHK